MTMQQMNTPVPTKKWYQQPITWVIAAVLTALCCCAPLTAAVGTIGINALRSAAPSISQPNSYPAPISGPNTCTQTPDQIAAELGLPGVTDINTLLSFFKVNKVVGDLKIVVDSDCRTIQIEVNNPNTDYFVMTNPFSKKLDGYLWQSQPNHPEWSPAGNQVGIPTGTWLSQGVTIWPGLK